MHKQYGYMYAHSREYLYKCTYSVDICMKLVENTYGVATVSRIDKIIGFFCRISSLLEVSFAKETYDFIDATNCSHPISAKSTGTGC